MSLFAPLALGVIYAVFLALLWPALNSFQVLAVGGAFFVSCITSLWTIGVMDDDDIAMERTHRERLRDIWLSLFPSLLLPAPFLAIALAVVWIKGQQPAAALCAIVVSAVTSVVQLRAVYARISTGKTLSEVLTPRRPNNSLERTRER